MVNDQITLASGFSFAERLTSSQQLAYKDDMTISLKQFNGKSPQKLFKDKNGSPSCPLAWSPDGRTLYHSYDQIYAIDVATRRSRPVTHFSDEDAVSVIWFLTVSPDGNELLFTEHKRMIFQDIMAARLQRNRAALPHHVARIRVDGTHYARLVEGTKDWDPSMVQCNWPRQLLVMVIVVNKPSPGFELWTSDMNGKNARRVGPFIAGPWLDLSPDARQVAYGGNEGIAILSLIDGKIEKLCEFGEFVSWSPDGMSIAFTKGDTELWLFHLAGKTSELLVKFTEPNPPERKVSYAQQPAWSPDGRYLWFTLTQATPRSEKKKRKWAKELEESQDALPLSKHEIAASLAMAEWEYDHKIGVVDFTDQKVWLQDGYWSDVAWRPIGEKQKAKRKDDYRKALEAFQHHRYKAAYTVLLRYAEQGHAEAQCMVGNYYDLGLGGWSANLEEATKWYTKSSNQGYGAASNNLGSLCARQGNSAQAKAWYTKAREQGFKHSPKKRTV